MALSVNQGQTYRLRDLRDNAAPRGRGELQAPTRRPKFEDKLRDPKAGEVVGQFPAEFDKAPPRPERPRRHVLKEAATRQRPRQAVAALMAREGISTATKFGAKFGAGAVEKPKKDDQPAWMQLLPEDKKEDKVIEQRMEKLEAARQELKVLDRFAKSIDGYSSLSKHLKSQDQRVLTEAGKLDRSMGNKAPTKEARNLELVKQQMAMDQQLNLKYLELQDKLQRGLTSLLSNLMKVRNECTKNAISNV